MKRNKISIFLFSTVYISLLCLCQAACQSNSSVDDITQESSTAPDTPESDIIRGHTRQKGKAIPPSNTISIQTAANKFTLRPKETSNLYANASTSVSDMPASMNNATPDAAPEQVANPSGIKTIPSSNTSTTQPTANKFTLNLKEATRRDGVRNLVLVTIKPHSRGMVLKDFFVTASFPRNEGTAKSSSGKYRNRFVYEGTLNRSILADTFLTNVNCLGAEDTSFAEGKEIMFKIEPKPSTAVSPGKTYTLTVTVECQGVSPHVATQSIELIAPASSPSSANRNTSSRK